MGQIIANFIGNYPTETLSQQLVFCGAIIITIVMVVWLLDLIVQLLKNFWR